MNISLKTILATTLLSLAASFSTANAESKTTQAVKQVDLEKYVGQWYEIAHLPMFFQRKCVANVTAQYTLNEDNTLAVSNACMTESGETIRSNAVGYTKNEANSQLKVSFLPKGLRWIPFTQGDYWILRLDADYQVALVGDPNRKYLWILSRSPQIDEMMYQSYLKTAQEYGYDVNKLIKLPHH